MGMWFEILPSMFIMGALYCGGDALSKLVHFGILGNVSSYFNVSIRTSCNKTGFLSLF